MRIGLMLSVVTCALSAYSNIVVAQDVAKVEAGKEVYNAYCVNCHGLDLESSGVTFDLKRLRANERSRFNNSVLNGKSQMPPWRGVLEARDLEMLWTYIRANAYP